MKLSAADEWIDNNLTTLHWVQSIAWQQSVHRRQGYVCYRFADRSISREFVNMHRIYLGRLSEHDPLHEYLQHDIQPQITGAEGHSQYRVFRLNGSNDVYLYEDRETGTKVIGKFFLSSRKKDAAKAISRLTREFDNLCMMRDYGL